MAKLYDVYEHPKERIKRDKAGRGGRKSDRRFLSPLEMAIVSQDTKNYNGMKKRGEMKDEANGYMCVCGCGNRGCIIQSSYASNGNPAGAELLRNIMGKSKSNKRTFEQKNKLAEKAALAAANALAIQRAGFDSKTSFRN